MTLVSVTLLILSLLVIFLIVRQNKILKAPAESSRIAALEATLEAERRQAATDKAEAERKLNEAKAEGRTMLADARREALEAEARRRVEYEQALTKAKDEARHAADEARREQDKRHAESIAALQQRFDDIMSKVQMQARTATDELLSMRQKEFAESSVQNISSIVGPLRETIENMKKAMNDNTTQQTAMGSAMEANIKHMLEHSEAAQRSAEELARVFKHGSKVQGDWGETVLTELLESQGLTEGVMFDVQSTIVDAHGNPVQTEVGSILRPDVILHLDAEREVIIDSKVSLTAFFDYVNAETDEARQAALKEHITSLRRHVDELSRKDYSSYVRKPKTTVGYVIMFVPNTGALWTALNAEPDFWRKAMDRNVYIADEQTLYAALRIVKLTWTQIRQAQNQEEVFGLANEMMDRVGQFVKHYADLGKYIGQVQKAFENGEKKLVPSGQSILQTCSKLQKLGAKQSPKNPIPQLNKVDDDTPAIEVGE